MHQVPFHIHGINTLLEKDGKTTASKKLMKNS
jgi:hypothetical protein